MKRWMSQKARPVDFIWAICALILSFLLVWLALNFAQSAHAATIRQTCNEFFNYAPHTTINPDNFAADWETNSCDYLLQVKAVCINGRGASGSFTSGKTALLETAITAHCTSTLPLLQSGWDRYSTDGGLSWSAWNKLYG